MRIEGIQNEGIFQENGLQTSVPAILIQEEHRFICIVHGESHGLDPTLLEKISQLVAEGLPDTSPSTEFYLLSCYAARQHPLLSRLSHLPHLLCLRPGHWARFSHFSMERNLESESRGRKISRDRGSDQFRFSRDVSSRMVRLFRGHRHFLD